MRVYTPDYVFDATARILKAMLLLFRRTPGPIADAVAYAAYRRTLEVLIADTRAAARSATLAADLAAIAAGYRAAAADMRAVIRGLERVPVAARAFQPVEARTATLARQRENEMALCLTFEALALAEIANAVAALTPRSHDEASQLRGRLGRTFDLAIERASEQGAIAVMRALRDAQAKLTRDLIERGRPLARIVAYETAVPLPAVVIAHRLYQDASRADELRDENSGTDHPSFMPTAGRAYSR